MAVDDKSLYIDNSAGSERMQQLFASGKMAMTISGPWALPEYVDGKIDYGVVPLPSFGGEATTIAGPDTWAIFDNGDDAVEGGDRVRLVAHRSGAAVPLDAGVGQPADPRRISRTCRSSPTTSRRCRASTRS